MSVVLGGPFVGDDSPLTGVEHWGVSSQFSLFTARGIPWVVSVIFGGPITGDDAQLTVVTSDDEALSSGPIFCVMSPDSLSVWYIDIYVTGSISQIPPGFTPGPLVLFSV